MQRRGQNEKERVQLTGNLNLLTKRVNIKSQKNKNSVQEIVTNELQITDNEKKFPCDNMSIMITSHSTT